MDFSALLGVQPGAPAEEVNSAFRKKSLLYHPDRCPNDPSAAERFRQLTAARDFLRAVARRTEVFPTTTFAPAAAPAPRSPPTAACQEASGRVRAKKAVERSKAKETPKERAKAPGLKMKEKERNARKRRREKERREKQKSVEKRRREKEKEKRQREQQKKKQQVLKLKQQREKEKLSKAREKNKRQKENGSAKGASAKKPKQEVEKVADEEDEEEAEEELDEDEEKEDAGTVDGDAEDDEEGGEGEEEEEEEEEADDEGEEEEVVEVAEVAQEVGARGANEWGERVEWQAREEEDEDAEDESIEDPEEMEEPDEIEADDDKVLVPEEIKDEEVGTQELPNACAEQIAEAEEPPEEVGTQEPSKACAEQSAEAEDNEAMSPSPKTSPRPKWRCLGRPADLTAKHGKHSSLSERLAKVLESETCGPAEVNIGARGMLASMVRKLGPRALQATSSSSTFRWHRHEVRVLGMVEETLTTVRAAASQTAASTASRAKAAARDVETGARLADAVASAQMELASREVEVGRCRELLARHEKSLAAAKTAEKEAAAEIRSAAQREASCSQERRRAVEAFNMFTKLEAAGGVQRKNPAAVDRMIKEIGRELEAAKLSETLASGHRRLVLPALKMEPDRRSRDSEAALSCAEGCMKDHLQELSARLSETSRAWARAKEAERRARSAVAASTDRKHEAIDALQTAKDELRDCGLALDSARAAQRKHKADLKQLAKEARAREAELTEVDAVLSALTPIALSITGGGC